MTNKVTLFNRLLRKVGHYEIYEEKFVYDSDKDDRISYLLVRDSEILKREYMYTEIERVFNQLIKLVRE